MSKLLAFAGILTIGAIAALMVATSNNTAPTTTLDQATIKRDMFNQWKLAHEKSYSSAAEEEKRFNIWSANYDWVQEHNAIPGNRYTVGMTLFADMTNQEFKQRNKGCTFNKTVPGTVSFQGSIQKVGDNPLSVDWRTVGAVTPVKNQGGCGSCWAFSTTGSLEGLNFLTNGNLLSFSEQQLVDCSTSYGNEGCNGGLMDYAFQYVADNGIELESIYPYSGTDGKCKYNAANVVFKNTGFADVPAKDSDALETAVAQQPVSVAIDASSIVFQLYVGGVVSALCGHSLDHGVLAVGYGKWLGEKYWLVKNSWGKTWGEAGYVKIAKQVGQGDGTCGIAMQASYPVINNQETLVAKVKKVHVHENGEN